MRENVGGLVFYIFFVKIVIDEVSMVFVWLRRTGRFGEVVYTCGVFTRL